MKAYRIHIPVSQISRNATQKKRTDQAEVIHYCMGGLECTVDAECFDKSGKVIPGLYVAGEAAGGIHGNNRLGGNSLLDCVVFGRVAGKAACKLTFGKDEKFKPCPTPGEIKELTK